MPVEDSSDWNLGGRYTLHGEIAAGGMATVHIGRMKGTAGFSKVVAIKRLHAQYAKDPDFVSMFLDEARLAARIHHPNVVQTLDVIATEGEVFLVMEYICGESLSKVLRALVPRDERMPLKVAAAVMVGVLHGLHAAHEASNEKGEKLGIVHRDMSPQNVLVGPDGIARVLDFGIAKAETRSYHTRDGDLKGKLAYMAPEQLTGEITVDRRTDIFAASIVLWEILTGRRLFDSDYQSAILRRIQETSVAAPSSFNPDLPPQLDALVLKGLARDPDDRFATAREMAIALEMCLPLATPSKVGEWVESVASVAIAARSARIAEIEKGLAPDVVQESKGILEELRLDGRGKHTKIERGSGRASQVDGREAARTPAPAKQARPSVSDAFSGSIPPVASPARSSPPPAPPSPSPRKSLPPPDELLPETQEGNIVDLSSEELHTSTTGAINANMLREIRAAVPQPQAAKPQRQSTLPSSGQAASQPRRASMPPPPTSSRRVPNAALHDIPPPSTASGSYSAMTPAPPSRPMYEEDVRPQHRAPPPPPSSDDIPPVSAPPASLPHSNMPLGPTSNRRPGSIPDVARPRPSVVPSQRPRLSSISGAHVVDDVPQLPPELAAPSVHQFALPEILAPRPPVDLKIDYQGKKQPTKFNWLALFLFFVMAGGAAYFALPAVVEQIYTTAAAKRGIALKVDRVEVQPHLIKFFGVNATSSDLPGVFVRAAEIDFNIRDAKPPTMHIIGLDATVNGPYPTIRDVLNRFLTVHPLKEGNDLSADAITAIQLEKGHFTWGGVAGDNTKLDFDDVAGRVEKQGDHALGEDFAFASPRFSIVTPVGTIGPYAATLVQGPFATRIDVTMLGSAQAKAELHYSDTANAGLVVDGKIGRTTIDALGIPRQMFALEVDERMQVEGYFHFARPNAQKVDCDAFMGLYGVKLAGAKAQVDVRFQVGFSGDPANPMVLNSGVMSFGGFRGEIWGKASLTRDAFHIDASYKTAPRSCSQITGTDATPLAQIAADPSTLDRQVNSSAGASQAFVSGSVVFDTRDLGATAINVMPSNRCGSKIFP